MGGRHARNGDSEAPFFGLSVRLVLLASLSWGTGVSRVNPVHYSTVSGLIASPESFFSHRTC